MAAKPETTFYTAIHKKLPPGIYRMKNNNAYAGGVPDCWYSGTNGDMWVEYKWLPKPPVRVNHTVELSELQRRWLNSRYEEGRDVCVILGYPGGGMILTSKQWNDPLTPEAFKRRLKTRDEIAAFIVEQVLG